MEEKKEYLPVYILIRTSERPKFFSVMMQSISEQTYPNIITIVHTDNPLDDYVEGDIIIRGEKPAGITGGAPYNLYCNRLLEAIPDGEGWYCFMDDDDMYAGPDVIETLVKLSKRKAVNVARSDRGDGNIWPRYWRCQDSFQTQCFFLHTDHKGKAKWWDKRAGDHHYSKQLTAIMPINWIDDFIIAKAQEGKGRGMKYDKGQAPRDERKVLIVPVYYLVRVKSPAFARGEAGEVRLMQHKHAEKMEQKKILKILDKSEYEMFIAKQLKK